MTETYETADEWLARRYPNAKPFEGKVYLLCFNGDTRYIDPRCEKKVKNNVSGTR